MIMIRNFVSVALLSLITKIRVEIFVFVFHFRFFFFFFLKVKGSHCLSITSQNTARIIIIINNNASLQGPFQLIQCDWNQIHPWWWWWSTWTAKQEKKRIKRLNNNESKRNINVVVVDHVHHHYYHHGSWWWWWYWLKLFFFEFFHILKWKKSKNLLFFSLMRMKKIYVLITKRKCNKYFIFIRIMWILLLCKPHGCDGWWPWWPCLNYLNFCCCFFRLLRVLSIIIIIMDHRSNWNKVSYIFQMIFVVFSWSPLWMTNILYDLIIIIMVVTLITVVVVVFLYHIFVHNHNDVNNLSLTLYRNFNFWQFSRYSLIFLC